MLAGYSEKAARQIGSRLLTYDDVREAVEKASRKADSSTERAIANVSAIANQPAQKVSSGDILKANELLLKVNGALKDRQSESRITVNIGFLTNGSQSAPTIEVMAVDAQGITPPARVLQSGGDSE